MQSCPAEERAITIQENLLIEKNIDLKKRYEVKEIIGVGSISTISLVQKTKNGSLESLMSVSKKMRRILRPVGNLFAKKKPQSTSSETEQGSFYALKTIDMRKVNEIYYDELRNEINVLRNLDHPNIIKAFEIYRWKKNFAIVMEHCSGGDLHSRESYSEEEAARIMKQLVSAVAYMHDHDIIHRDIKHENIMFESNHPMAAVKLIDFGLSKMYLREDFILTERVGTIYTMAPEVLKGNYSYKADMWSLGVVAYMLLTSCIPFYGKTRREVANKIQKERLTYDGTEWTHTTSEVKDFVKLLLTRDANKRSSAEEAREAAWLNKNIPHSKHKPSVCLPNSFAKFAAAGEIQKMAFTVIAHKASSEEILSLRDMFYEIDTDNSGYISQDEFKKAFSESNYSEEELNKIFEAVDINKHGHINYTEFLAATLETQGLITTKSLTDAFDRLDSDDTGFISNENLRKILGENCSPACVEQIIKDIDEDHDGKISFDEFMSAFNSQKKQELAKCSDFPCC